MLKEALRGNQKSRNEYLHHIEFAYDRVVRKTTIISPFEVVYSFNRLTPLDLIPFPNLHEFIHKEGYPRLKKLHKRVREQIRK